MDINTFTQGVLPLIDDLLYMSESERNWQLLDTAGIQDQASLDQQLAAFPGADAADLQRFSLDELQARIQRQADPGEEFMVQLANRYDVLFAFLREHLTDIAVIRSGSVQVQVFVTGFLADGTAVVLHTEAIET
ncbi:nuclease A inhibitor family protein [Chitinophaga nivalis]|uniref:Nuclease A inhibitor family protein n=1 Tax=Chitinophaga nivalis TaxID=2991709 RepID=A0ABT3IKK9_9BACT|nr:nuclease A inhibitor family protein [Chitinophaga nivalis]MCW3465810.1 nuclease A inhibitor family protein [Chitinophaga nivalis]MCW3484499.1 nuclease A inhibitor family protein [Chitinophaga nivalis]